MVISQPQQQNFLANEPPSDKKIGSGDCGSNISGGPPFMAERNSTTGSERSELFQQYCSTKKKNPITSNSTADITLGQPGLFGACVAVLFVMLLPPLFGDGDDTAAVRSEHLLFSAIRKISFSPPFFYEAGNKNNYLDTLQVCLSNR